MLELRSCCIAEPAALRTLAQRISQGDLGSRLPLASGDNSSLAAALQAMQQDEAQNPGQLVVAEGRAQARLRQGGAGPGRVDAGLAGENPTPTRP